MKVYSLVETRVDNTTSTKVYDTESKAIFQMAYKAGQLAQLHESAVVFPNQNHTAVDIWKETPGNHFKFIANFKIKEAKS